MTTSRDNLQIAPPDPDRPPMLANAFLAARSMNTALAPMFPYCGDGDMVPGVSIFFGGEDRKIGHFHHMNTVDEVAICLGSRGSQVHTGSVFAGAREHLVGSFFDDEANDDNLMVIVVVQRQSDAGVPQNEKMAFHCSQCQTELAARSFPAKHDETPYRTSPGYASPLDTLLEGAELARGFNAPGDSRKCPSCGHVNDEFPLSMWGWGAYRDNFFASEEARLDLLAEQKKLAKGN